MAEYDIIGDTSSIKLPYSPEAERALLGAVILDSEYMSGIV